MSDTIVTNSAAVFTSSEMKDSFLHKYALKKLKEGPLETQNQGFLVKYKITSHSTMGISPANLLINRQPKFKLDLVLPNLSKRVTNVQDKQKQQHDQHAKC